MENPNYLTLFGSNYDLHCFLAQCVCISPHCEQFSCVFPAVELLSEVMQNCSLNEAEIEQQRGVVLRELEEVEGNLQDVCLDLLHATAFQGTPLGHSVLGPSSNARQEEHTHLTISHRISFIKGTLQYCNAANYGFKSSASPKHFHFRLISIIQFSQDSDPPGPGGLHQQPLQSPSHGAGCCWR